MDFPHRFNWKEEMTLRNSAGELYKFNIFLYVLTYSKYKYLTITFDRSQDTLLSCLTQTFEATGGIPHEIWFDNMKTVVDHSKSSFCHAVFNQRFYQFSNDTGFKPIACRCHSWSSNFKFTPHCNFCRITEKIMDQS